ncbi:hypothetical protein EIN_168690 [Entamoeba invadens IP1]|uniref:Uncharacterized protein n=1 Tax=Entamoeba invadens IP1 TaxID=370355 RepID=A0A0A1TVK1_ENTIV|nr:hypothetical protein EIN_168690 [Entamoeba invadens IP1]ELP84474.1 hypothetical protein EIN_168690 [Entamoeba invadens IP1]|eukprot:XP_004183820.1 hypothetical protein EIN_168690 [Entamoeba invadens IP1]
MKSILLKQRQFQRRTSAHSLKTPARVVEAPIKDDYNTYRTKINATEKEFDKLKESATIAPQSAKNEVKKEENVVQKTPAEIEDENRLEEIRKIAHDFELKSKPLTVNTQLVSQKYFDTLPFNKKTNYFSTTMPQYDLGDYFGVSQESLMVLQRPHRHSKRQHFAEKIEVDPKEQLVDWSITPFVKKVVLFLIEKCKGYGVTQEMVIISVLCNGGIVPVKNAGRRCAKYMQMAQTDLEATAKKIENIYTTQAKTRATAEKVVAVKELRKSIKEIKQKLSSRNYRSEKTKYLTYSTIKEKQNAFEKLTEDMMKEEEERLQAKVVLLKKEMNDFIGDNSDVKKYTKEDVCNVIGMYMGDLSQEVTVNDFDICQQALKQQEEIKQKLSSIMERVKFTKDIFVSKELMSQVFPDSLPESFILGVPKCCDKLIAKHKEMIDCEKYQRGLAPFVEAKKKTMDEYKSRTILLHFRTKLASKNFMYECRTANVKGARLTHVGMPETHPKIMEEFLYKKSTIISKQGGYNPYYYETALFCARANITRKMFDTLNQKIETIYYQNFNTEDNVKLGTVKIDANTVVKQIFKTFNYKEISDALNEENDKVVEWLRECRKPLAEKRLQMLQRKAKKEMKLKKSDDSSDNNNDENSGDISDSFSE